MAMLQKKLLKMNADGRVLIPAEYRREMGLKPGDEFVLLMDGDEIRLTTVSRVVEKAQKTLRESMKAKRQAGSLVDDLIAERREAAKHE